jgi:hypothetical protein
MSIIITHNAGFFSCCSVKLSNIINFFNNNKKLPEHVDSSAQFNWYKSNKSRDVTYDYFDSINTSIIHKIDIDYHNEHQFIDYSKLQYKNICPFIKKYFSPSLEIKNIIIDIEKKYDLNYENICVLFYRGNDKNTETKICGYSEYIIYAKKILNNNPNILFLIQSDETEFIEEMTLRFPQNSFYLKDEIRHMKKCNGTVDILIRNEIEKYSKLYLAITIIMSKCNYIICGSGNCSIWIMLYRENFNNVYQNLNDQWII